MSAFDRSRAEPQAAAVWRARLDKAKAAYDLAVAEFRRTTEEYRFRETPSPDGELAVRRALQAEAAAREHYMDVLRVFTELVVDGKVPPQDKTGEPAEPGAQD